MSDILFPQTSERIFSSSSSVEKTDTDNNDKTKYDQISLSKALMMQPIRVFARIKPNVSQINRVFSGESQSRKNYGSPSQALLTSSIISNIPIRRNKINSKSSYGNCIEIINSNVLNIVKIEGIFRNSPKSYEFDSIFCEDARQEEIYSQISDLVVSTVNGFNSTILVHGATGSGKTHTMIGDDYDPGIIPRAMEDLFNQLEIMKSNEPEKMFFIEISFVEFYNNQFRNLIYKLEDENKIARSNGLFGNYFDSSPKSPTIKSPKKSSKLEKIDIHESNDIGVFLSGNGVRQHVTCAQEALDFVHLGNKNRVIKLNEDNEKSSRGHGILTLHVESRAILSEDDLNSTNNTSPASELKLSKLQFVDLAGSTKVTQSDLSNVFRTKNAEITAETQSIHTSLASFGDVLSSLSKNAPILLSKQSKNRRNSWKSVESTDNSKLLHIPYLNSKLTYLLKDAFGGNSNTVFIATVKPDQDSYQQTSSTLLYASWARNIRNKHFIVKSDMRKEWQVEDDPEVEKLKKILEERSKQFLTRYLMQHRSSLGGSNLKLLSSRGASEDDFLNRLSLSVDELSQSNSTFKSLFLSPKGEIYGKKSNSCEANNSVILKHNKELQSSNKALHDKIKALESVSIKSVEVLKEYKEMKIKLSKLEKRLKDSDNVSHNIAYVQQDDDKMVIEMDDYDAGSSAAGSAVSALSVSLAGDMKDTSYQKPSFASKFPIYRTNSNNKTTNGSAFGTSVNPNNSKQSKIPTRRGSQHDQSDDISILTNSVSGTSFATSPSIGYVNNNQNQMIYTSVTSKNGVPSNNLTPTIKTKKFIPTPRLSNTSNYTNQITSPIIKNNNSPQVNHSYSSNASLNSSNTTLSHSQQPSLSENLKIQSLQYDLKSSRNKLRDMTNQFKELKTKTSNDHNIMAQLEEDFSKARKRIVEQNEEYQKMMNKETISTHEFTSQIEKLQTSLNKKDKMINDLNGQLSELTLLMSENNKLLEKSKLKCKELRQELNQIKHENQLEILAQEKEFLELNAMESLNRRIGDLMKVLSEPIPTIAVTNDEMVELATNEQQKLNVNSRNGSLLDSRSSFKSDVLITDPVVHASPSLSSLFERVEESHSIQNATSPPLPSRNNSIVGGTTTSPGSLPLSLTSVASMIDTKQREEMAKTIKHFHDERSQLMKEISKLRDISQNKTKDIEQMKIKIKKLEQNGASSANEGDSIKQQQHNGHRPNIVQHPPVVLESIKSLRTTVKSILKSIKSEVKDSAEVDGDDSLSVINDSISNFNVEAERNGLSQQHNNNNNNDNNNNNNNNNNNPVDDNNIITTTNNSISTNASSVTFGSSGTSLLSSENESLDIINQQLSAHVSELEKVVSLKSLEISEIKKNYRSLGMEVETKTVDYYQLKSDYDILMNSLWELRQELRIKSQQKESIDDLIKQVNEKDEKIKILQSKIDELINESIKNEY
eukprot:gene7746-10523_t